MEVLPVIRSSIEIESLQKASLKNEEIIELMAFFTSAESVAPFHQHIQVLRDKYDISLEMRPLEIEVLSLRSQFNIRKLKNLYIALEDQGYASLILPTIRGYQHDKSAAIYITILEQIFGIEPDREFLKQIIEFIDNSDMDGPGIIAIRKHFLHQLDNVAGYAPIPTYVKDFSIKLNELPHLEEKEISTEYPPDLIADYLLTQLGNLDITITADSSDEAKEILMSKIGKMSEIQKEQFIKIAKVDNREIENLRADRDIFRVYGPVNPYADTDFSNLETEDGKLDVNVIYGGARMFTDMSLEYDYDAELPMNDWFTGSCNTCSSRIRSYHHAVRAPLLTGGWRGCFCNWECVRKFEELDTPADPDLYNMYVIDMALTRELEKEMNDIGIQDRDYDVKTDLDADGYDSQEVDYDIVEDTKAKLPQIDFSVASPPAVPIDFGEGTAET